MKKIIAIISMIGLMMVTGIGWAETITIAITPICPHMCDPETEDGFAGFAVEITEEVFKAAGYEMEMKVLPWIRAMKMFEAGEVDSIHLIKSHAIEMKDVIFTAIPVTKFNNKFYAHQGNSWSAGWTYYGAASLQDLKFGAIKGWTYMNKELDTYIANTPAPQVDFSFGEDAIEQSIRKVLHDYLDVIIMNPSMLIRAVSKMQNDSQQVTLDALIDLGWVPNDEDVGSYVTFQATERGKKLADDFNRAMFQYKESGKLNEKWKQWDIKE